MSRIMLTMSNFKHQKFDIAFQIHEEKYIKKCKIKGSRCFNSFIGEVNFT